MERTVTFEQIEDLVYSADFERTDSTDLCPALRKEFAANPCPQRRVLVVTLPGEATTVRMLCLDGRWGISWGADPEWCDASDEEEALTKFFSGECE